MQHMSWVTTWEEWRKVLGRPNSLQRRNVDNFLETHPAILYWGDSWFSTPLYLNLAKQSVRRIQGLNMIIGKPGAEAAELFSKPEVARLAGRIESNPFDVVCLSAGGNDCLDENLAKLFADWMGKKPKRTDRLDAAQAYSLFKNSTLLGEVTASYDRLLSRLKEIQADRKTLRVVGHPYVPIDLIGRPAGLTVDNIGLIAWLKNDVGPWLWGPMKFVLEDKLQGKEFAQLMLTEGFHKSVLLKLQEKYHGLFRVVDYSSAQGMSDLDFWNDEIHPTERGFEILASPFNAAIRSILPESKQVAVSV